MGELASPLEIRAHHLLCLLGFRGLGYSWEFIANMGKVAEELHSDPTFPITVIAECDVICASCPHNKDNQCQKEANSEAKVKARDLEVLQRLGLKKGAQIPVCKAWKKIREKLTLRDIVEICQGCEWLRLGHCTEGLGRIVLDDMGGS